MGVSVGAKSVIVEVAGTTREAGASVDVDAAVEIGLAFIPCGLGRLQEVIRREKITKKQSLIINNFTSCTNPY